jgi:hypothetical protein
MKFTEWIFVDLVHAVAAILGMDMKIAKAYFQKRKDHE